MRPEDRVVADERFWREAEGAYATRRLILGAVVDPPDRQDREGRPQRRRHQAVAPHPGRQAEIQQVGEQPVATEPALALFRGERRIVQREEDRTGVVWGNSVSIRVNTSGRSTINKTTIPNQFTQHTVTN